MTRILAQVNKVTIHDGVESVDFQYDFCLDGKAVVDTDDNGDLYIEGYASNFDIDRQDEAFEPGAFDAGLKSYMENNPLMLYHHKPDFPMGQITEARMDTKGLFVKGRVDKPEPNTAAADIFSKVKKGTVRMFSVGGKFYRRMTSAGPKIFKCDLREISITPLAVNQGTLFSIAGKAFEQEQETTVDLETIGARLDAIGAQFEAAWEEAVWQELAAGKAVTTEDLLRFEKVFEEHEGKAAKFQGSQIGQGHPDAGKIALLLMHQQKIATLAEDTAQNAKDPEVKKVATAAWNSAKKHSAALHTVAAKVGPLPDYYSNY